MANLFLGFPVSKAKFAEVAGAVASAFDFTKTILWFNSFDTLDGFDPTVAGTGTITFDFDRVTLSTGANALSSALIGKALENPIGPLTWAKKRNLKLRPYVLVANDATPVIQIFTGNVLAAGLGMGFIFERTKVRAFLRNAAGIEYADLVTGLVCPWANTYTLEVIWTPGVKAEFYIDGVLKGTLTTRLPTGTTDANQLFAAKVESTDAADHQIILSQVLLQQVL